MTIATYLPKTNEALIYPDGAAERDALRRIGAYSTVGQMRIVLTGTVAPKLRDFLRTGKAVTAPQLAEQIFLLTLGSDQLPVVSDQRGTNL